MKAIKLPDEESRIAALQAKLKAERDKAQKKADTAALAIGHAVLREMEHNEAFGASLRPVLDRRVSGSRIRKMLGLAREPEGTERQNAGPANAAPASSVWESAQASKSNVS